MVVFERISRHRSGSFGGTCSPLIQMWNGAPAGWKNATECVISQQNGPFHERAQRCGVRGQWGSVPLGWMALWSLLRRRL